MQKVSASASRTLPTQDPRRFSYIKLPSPRTASRQPPTSCNCELPEKPDNWTEKMWRKYLLTMARLPCKPCGWSGGAIFASRHVAPGFGLTKTASRRIGAMSSASKSRRVAREDELPAVQEGVVPPLAHYQPAPAAAGGAGGAARTTGRRAAASSSSPAPSADASLPRPPDELEDAGFVCSGQKKK